jgi:uncharacterized protein (DUF111 family)
MKKNRPGVKLTVVVPPEMKEELAGLILRESTTIGVRTSTVQRFILPRRVEERSTSLGKVRVKVVLAGDQPLRVVPEYEECRRLAEETGLPLLEIYRRVERELAP